MTLGILAVVATAAFMVVFLSLFRGRDLGVDARLRAFEDEEQMRAIRPPALTDTRGRLTATQS